METGVRINFLQSVHRRDNKYDRREARREGGEEHTSDGK